MVESINQSEVNYITEMVDINQGKNMDDVLHFLKKKQVKEIISSGFQLQGKMKLNFDQIKASQFNTVMEDSERKLTLSKQSQTQKNQTKKQKPSLHKSPLEDDQIILSKSRKEKKIHQKSREIKQRKILIKSSPSKGLILNKKKTKNMASMKFDNQNCSLKNKSPKSLSGQTNVLRASSKKLLIKGKNSNSVKKQPKVPLLSSYVKSLLQRKASKLNE